ncbi:Ig-like domain-containing protein [Collimonas sp. H4R21]|uniref:Ig-like domain-containing protein n=1 Tax=Collimonas rhizosphaerae TaxID=3126357 RepID=A0ABU9Q3J3_9BURK
MAGNAVKLLVVDGKEITQAVDLRTTKQGTASKVKAIRGGKYILADAETGTAPENITVRRVGSDLHVSLEGTGYDQPELIIENFYGNEGQLVGVAEDGAYYQYIASDAESDHAMAFLADGVASPQVLGGEQLVGFGSGLVPAAGMSWLGLGLFGLGALGLIGAAFAAGSGGGNGGGGGPGDGGGGRPGKPSIDQVYDNVEPSGPIAPGGVTNDQTPVFTGRGETPGNKIEIWDGDKKIGETVVKDDGTWEFKPTNPLPHGPHEIIAVEIDPEGNRSDPSDPIDFDVDIQAPGKPLIESVVDDVEPFMGEVPDGGLTNDNRPTLNGKGEPGARLDIYDNGELIGSTTVRDDGTWTFRPDTPLNDGDHAFTVVATDKAGNVGLPSDSHTIIVDTAAPDRPVIAEVFDSNGDPIAPGDSTSEDRPTIKGTAEPYSFVTIYNHGVKIGETEADEYGNWKFRPDTPLTNERHEFTAEATDKAGNVSEPSNQWDLIVDTSAPVRPVITEVIDNEGANQGPINPGDTTDDAQPVINGTAKPFSTVELFDNGNSIGSTTADFYGNWTFQPITPLIGGSHVLTAVATDPLGNVTTSDQFNFSVDIFGFGSLYGAEDFESMRAAAPPWLDDETRNTDLFEITKVGGGTQVYIVTGGGTGPGSSNLGLANQSGSKDEAVRFDLAEGKIAGGLTLDYRADGLSGNNAATIEFYDANGNVIHTVDLGADNAGLVTIPMPDGLAYASFSIFVENGRQLQFGSMYVSDSVAIPFEDFESMRAAAPPWLDDETRNTDLFEITKVGGGTQVYIVTGDGTGPGSSNLGLTNQSGSKDEAVRFDLAEGKIAGGLTLDYRADGLSGNNAATIEFYDANGNVIHTVDLGAYNAGIVTIPMPDGLAYASFSIFVENGMQLQFGSLIMGQVTDFPTSSTVDNEIRDLDILGGEVFYVGEGEEDTFEAHGDDQSNTLKLTGADQVLDFSQLGDRVSSVEVVDLTGTGNNTLKLSLNDVLEQGSKGMFINDDSTQMMVKGDAGDKVDLAGLLGDWATQGAVTIGGVVYNVYQNGSLNIDLLVQQGVETSFA